MESADLEKVLRATLAVQHVTARDVRDALVDYFVVAAGPFIQRGLRYSQPDADAATLRRLYELRLRLLWHGLPSKFDAPTLADLARFRQRIDRYACVAAADARLLHVRRLLDELMLAVAVRERLEAVRGRVPLRRFQSIDGGGETTAPCGRLALVRAGPTPEAT
jgi:hypothetical protein